jgi:hypothetical protein
MRPLRFFAASNRPYSKGTFLTDRLRYRNNKPFMQGTS